MSFFLIKSILALLLLASGVAAVVSKLSTMGQSDRKISPQTSRKIHKFSGWLFLLLLLPLLFLGMGHWVKLGDGASTRAVFHAVLGLGLTIITFFKVVIAKFYKQFLKFAPVMGIVVFCFAFVVFSISAGFYTLRAWSTETTTSDKSEPISSRIIGDAAKGGDLFKTHCSSCHYADSKNTKDGPGLRDLFKKKNLPYSGRPATAANVRRQLLHPAMAMPSFAKLSDQEIADLIAYLKTL